MSSGIGFRHARRLVGTLALFAAVAGGSTPASASDARSSPEDRQRFVAVTRNLEQAPLKPGLKADREWALEWLVEAPDVTVTICADALGGLVRSKYPYAAEILLQNSFSMATFMIDHPEMANDPQAQQSAGVEGALNAYRSILRDRPDARSPDLDRLLHTQASGGLPAFIRKAWIRCSRKK